MEESLIRNFIKKERQERLLHLINSKKGRNKLRQRLSHFLEFNERYIHKIPANQQTSDAILKLLINKGATDSCYLISEDPELDGKTLPLNTALDKVVGFGMCTIICCNPNKLAYYEGEEPKERYLLTK